MRASLMSTRQWAQLPVPGTTRVWLDDRIEGTISLVIGSWMTAGSRAKSMHIMGSFRTGEVGTYCDDHDLAPRKPGEHG